MGRRKQEGVLMFGLIPAAGKGKRLGMGCKPLIRVGNKYLIEYPLTNILNMGLKRAVIIQNDDLIEKTMGYDWRGIKLTYIKQEELKGIAHAISLAESKTTEDMFIIFADVVYIGDDLKKMKKFFDSIKDIHHALFGVKELPDNDKDEIMKSYGIRKIDEITYEIIEKPEYVNDLEPFLGLGIYMATPKIFDYIRKTPKSDKRNEIEITDTLNLLAKSSRVGAFKLKGSYINVNTKNDLRNLRERINGKHNIK